MSMKRKGGLLPHLAISLLLLAPAFAQQTCTNQSPRNVTIDLTISNRPSYNYVSTTALAIPATDPAWPEAIYYQKQLLRRCDQHYHAPVENKQGCPREDGSAATESSAPSPDSGPPPEAGKWIEVHTVFALGVNNEGACHDYLDHDLACCTKPPFVVVAYSAKVDRDGADVPVLKPPIPPEVRVISEWSGSTTGRDDATNCKPVPAQWNFAFGCGFKVPRNQLEKLFPRHGPHFARPEQTGNRVSSDLTLVGSNNELANFTCKAVSTTRIIDNNDAKERCPGVCRNTLTVPAFTGNWWNKPDTVGNCQCCPLYRPQ